MERSNLVFVYGTLLSGFGNWSYLLQDQSDMVGEFILPPSTYKMYSCGGFPCLVKDMEGPPIHGEVYKVDDKVLKNLDGLEGYPGWYERHTVATPWGDAYVYAMATPKGRPEVTSGSWRSETGRQKVA